MSAHPTGYAGAASGSSPQAALAVLSGSFADVINAQDEDTTSTIPYANADW